VWLQQNWPQYQPGIMWGEPPPERIITVNVDGQSVEDAAREIKAVHDRMRQDRFEPPYQYAWEPYHVVVQCTASRGDFLEWAELRRLRQHHGDKIVVDGRIVKRTKDNADTWTGDFLLEVIDETGTNSVGAAVRGPGARREGGGYAEIVSGAG